MKTIAFYLPQFHRIPENDEWWGEGYTEWVAVKKAKKLFENHYQPHIPLDANYYNLLEKDTMLWQSKLMHKYGIDGLCFYHYYFNNGKKILEKPAENLLKWKDIDMPFCFSWANETWARTWSRIQVKNVWNSEEEVQDKGNDDGILLEQEYGKEVEWTKHFNYLLPFFKDERYIKVNDRPVFVIHKADLIPCLYKMKKVWNELAKKNGISGIYFIGANSYRTELDAYIRQEPNYSFGTGNMNIQYEDASCEIIKNALVVNDYTYLCGTPGYDDTPRRGSAGKIMTNTTPEKFCNQMKTLYKIADERNHEFIFINAWNEWGEGMHLEPDVEFEYGYLEAVSKAKECYMSYDYMEEIVDINNRYIINKLQFENYKSKDMVRILDTLLSITNLEGKIEEYLKRNNINTFAIYGIGILGEQLVRLLKNINMKPMYGIDICAKKINHEFPVIAPSEECPDVDMVIVSAPTFFPEIYELLSQKGLDNIVSLDEMLEELKR